MRVRILVCMDVRVHMYVRAIYYGICYCLFVKSFKSKARNISMYSILLITIEYNCFILLF